MIGISKHFKMIGERIGLPIHAWYHRSNHAIWTHGSEMEYKIAWYGWDFFVFNWNITYLNWNIIQWSIVLNIKKPVPKNSWGRIYNMIVIRIGTVSPILLTRIGKWLDFQSLPKWWWTVSEIINLRIGHNPGYLSRPDLSIMHRCNLS